MQGYRNGIDLPVQGDIDYGLGVEDCDMVMPREFLQKFNKILISYNINVANMSIASFEEDGKLGYKVSFKIFGNLPASKKEEFGIAYWSLISSPYSYLNLKTGESTNTGPATEIQMGIIYT